MEFIQHYAKEIFSLVIPLITWFLNNRFKARAKLQLAIPHSFTFIVDEPLRDPDGNVIREKQSVHTASHVISNSGRETATRVELVFNWKPLCINIWPSRHYEQHSEQDGRHVMVFESLAPNEQIGFELLSVNNDLPALINARSDQCTATTIAMYPQPVESAWKRRLAVTLLFMGFSFAIYLTIILLQFLILANNGGI
ncbi:Uncharacterised protein [Zhongshania aliphaticivorans]|uniref:Uncharacterized protein n=1 Tax=Zhongshania aliphaticivorans TaxID=1470434 RepID=A0A5S9NY08_9GAMM|nr:hypothetical protein [Zhongshania aliphaticivorans]CAA0089067.1 Uncharacterised protein [Zhongshania aliphaticivorans]CAA0095671.1 Uncharacterised protein [Zhongshania aliphaticivorans]